MTKAPNRFARVPAWVATLKLTATAWRLLIEICAHLNRDEQAWPSLGRMARDWGIDRSNLTRALHELEAAGVLVSKRQTHKKNIGEDRRLYRVNFNPDQRERFQAEAQRIRSVEGATRETARITAAATAAVNDEDVAA
ncbi:helix-turn-helix domain-containing protein [Azospirillum sp. B2RO_4]|uniref:helix-turn-helix domain-containing protein n=1 Tax=Azospirillum sp. B2RO_4 TaxID=3027796 RepID=UPI003DA9516E